MWWKVRKNSKIANILEIIKLKCFKGQETGVRGVRDERLGTGSSTTQLHFVKTINGYCHSVIHILPFSHSCE